MQVEINEPFSAIFARLSGQKPEVTREHMALLNERYDLSNRPATGVTMDRTKPVQEGVRVKLPAGNTSIRSTQRSSWLQTRSRAAFKGSWTASSSSKPPTRWTAIQEKPRWPAS
jgi:hypothetical protein